MKAVLYMVIPCYNEEEVLPVTSGLFLEELQLLIEKEKISEESRILFVNDGSKDRTWENYRRTCQGESTLYWNLSKPQQRTSECSPCRTDGGKSVSDITDIVDCDGQDDTHEGQRVVLTMTGGVV